MEKDRVKAKMIICARLSGWTQRAIARDFAGSDDQMLGAELVHDAAYLLGLTPAEVGVAVEAVETRRQALMKNLESKISEEFYRLKMERCPTPKELFEYLVELGKCVESKADKDNKIAELEGIKKRSI